MTKLLSLTNICISVWQKYLSSVQMHLLKDTSCSCSTIHNFTVQHSLKYKWNFGKKCLYNKSYNMGEKFIITLLFSDIGGGTTVCAHKHHIQIIYRVYCLPLLPMPANMTASRERVFQQHQPHSWKIHAWARQFRMPVLAGGWMFKYHIAQEIFQLTHLDNWQTI